MKTLRRRYTWVIGGLVAAALLTHGLVQAVFAFNAGLEQVQRQQEYEARLAAAHIGQYVQRLIRSAQWLADFARGDLAPDWARLRTEAHIVLRQEAAIQRIVIVRTADDRCFVVARAEADGERDCRSEGLAPLHHAVVEQKSEVVAPSSEPTKLRLIASASPDARWRVVAEINLSFAWDVISEISAPGRGQAVVADREGRLIAHRDVAEVAAAHNRPVLSGSGDGAFVASVIEPLDSRLVVRASQPVPGLEWSVVVESPIRAVLSPVLAEMARASGLGLLWGTVAVAVAIMLARGLARPVGLLEQSVRAFGAGDRQRRIDIACDDELGSLAASFNRMADELQAYTGELESRVAEKTRELAQANEHKSQFLANVSHELRTPLNAIIGYSEALKEDIFGPLTPKQRESAADIHSSGLHLLALINDLLDLSKVEAGRMDLDLASFEVRELVDRSLNVLRERAASAGVTLQADLDDNIGSWIGDELRLRQCVMNLLSNGVKFTRAGGTVTLAVRQTSQELTVEVTDTGVGIPEDQLPRLFERFSRIQHVVPADFAAPQGTGLGLALTKSFVELHGGRITVSSRVGEGSTFTVVLPALQQMKDEHGDGAGR